MESGFDLEVFPELPQDAWQVEDSPSGVDAILQYCRTAGLKAERKIPFIKAIAREATLADTGTLFGDLVPLVEDLAKDTEEDIRMSIAGILEPVGQAIHQQPACESSPALGAMVGCGFDLVTDSNVDVRDMALEATTGLAVLLDAERQEKLFGPAVQGCLSSNDVTDRRYGVKLLGGLSEKRIHLGPDELRINWVVQTSQDSNVEVREEVATILPAVLSNLQGPCNNSLIISRFIMLANDKVWSVRRSCAQALPTLINVITNLGSSVSTHECVLATLHNLCRDRSNWVKIAALMSLGPVLMELKLEVLDESLLEHYASMASVRFGATDSSVVLSCACHLPGVVKKTGREKWSMLCNLYSKLLESPDERVRYTLGCSAHEIAAVLSPEAVKDDLVPGIRRLMTDQSGHVRLGMAKYLARLLRKLPHECHESFLQLLSELLSPHPARSSEDSDDTTISSEDSNTSHHNTRNWRVREMIARELHELVKVIAPEFVLEYILPCAFDLCHDDVALVRSIMADQLAAVLSIAQEHGKKDQEDVRGSCWEQDPILKAISEKIVCLGKGRNFVDRCLCARVCCAAMRKGINILDLDSIGAVVHGFRKDPVQDVRIAYNSLPFQK